MTIVHPLETSGHPVSALPGDLPLEAFDDAQTAFLVFDADLRILHVSSGLPAVLGFEFNGVTRNSNASDLLSSSGATQDSIAQAKTCMSAFTAASSPTSAILRSPASSQEVRMTLRAAGEFRLASFEISPDEASGTQEIQLLQRDSLTGLPTRRSFEESVTEKLARAPQEPVAILLVGLDRIQAVNAIHGHAAGDSILRLAAERLQSIVSKTGTVARLGGDEFAILLTSTCLREGVAAIANRFLDLVQRPYLFEGQLVNIGAGIGIACAPQDGRHCATLLHNAGLALADSKTFGRANFRFFEPHMEHRAQMRHTTELGTPPRIGLAPTGTALSTPGQHPAWRPAWF